MFYLSGDVGRGSVNGLEDGSVLADVATRGQAEAADQTGAEIGQNVAVQIRLKNRKKIYLFSEELIFVFRKWE